MPNSFLVAESKVTENGSGAPLELGVSAGKMLLLTLGITNIAEQQSLDVAVWGSAEGSDWGAKPLLVFPQKFYRGTYALLLDLGQRPEARYLQARWQVARWGVGSTTPMFVFYVFAEPFVEGRAA